MAISTTLNCPDSTVITKASLLFVDENNQQFKKNKEVFSKLYNNLYTAHNQEDALKLYFEQETQLSLIAINLDCPHINGIECIKQIRHNDIDVPILIISNFDNPDTLLKVLKFNIQNYIAIPILMNTTVRIMVEILTEIENQKLIRRQQVELAQFKDILDKQNLVSETDLNGVITYANDIFCEVSGYTQEELVGKNHNIVRHPNTPSNIFKELWNTIQKGDIWQGKIKNLAKDGSSYFVKALVIPMFDRDGNIVKYTSSRFLITEDEKHKQMLKKQILSHKTAGFSQYKKCQEEIQVALEMQEIDFKEDFVKIETTLHDVNQERKDLKRKLQGREKKIFELEDEVKRQMQRYESMQSQMHKKAQDEYSKNQDSNKNYDHLVIAKNKLEEDVNAGQYTIRKMQERIDEYIKRIDDLNDVIKSNGL